MAAPKGNLNALRTGHRTNRAGMVLGELGKRHRAIYQHVKQLRRGLERLLRDAQGQLPLLVVAQVNECCRWELVARIAQKAVADTEQAPAGEVLNLLNVGANATRNRNAIMAAAVGRETTDSRPVGGIRHSATCALSRPPTMPPILESTRAAPAPAKLTGPHIAWPVPWKGNRPTRATATR